ncbi:NADH:flavin oxidoreductase/NADH oxidase family protein [Sporosarcina sp. E16_8]|uniref:NADH:flavin oxidoreductase/NADH oxidase family protein n=1 Tax=Sporosarcina sp. E16_8 TaxID=2789295 RepID=UPI001A934911|nr:NADH:flavin oxidoreductase/NADH oxidase family protein [Sporosarcina sp. E16_8]MBO0588014.1 NADH:flavin oxidoreductase/NADH oxidase family protein [Sporosarcina sp. E16_8]
MNQSKSVLGNSLQLPNGTIIKNRIFKSAMSEALGTAHQNPSESLVTLYKTWAEGGAGIVMTGNVMIDRNALGEPNNVAVEDERDLIMLMKWAKAGTENGTHLWMQLNHPGKQSPKMISKEPVAPSAVPLTGGLKRFFNQPRALQVSEIKDLINRFGEAARIAKKAGFTGVQIHAAHGYLFNQFLSPYHNQRTDEWGGTLANRMRFLEETYKEIRKQVGRSFPIGIKLNSADFQKGGFTEDESMEVLQKMSEIGIDLIEISGGNYENPIMMGADVKETTKNREAYFIDYAKKAQELISTPLVVTGGFRSQKGMEEAIANGEIDMVGIARPFALVPDLANRIFNGSYETVHAKPIRTGIKQIDKSASLLEIGWYEQQLARMGKSKSPNPDHNVWISLIQNLLGNGRSVFLRRRA